MSKPIEDYALIGDCETAALVARDGSMDWLCLPRFDSGACFAALLGGPEHGRWQIAPVGDVREVRRRYRGDTLVLETEFRTETGVAAVIDFMPPRDTGADVIRIVEGRGGRVEMTCDLRIRFDYGSVVPWVRRVPGGILATAGPDTLRLRTPVPLRGVDFRTVARFAVGPGERVPFDMTWHLSHEPEPGTSDPSEALVATEAWWRAWADKCTYRGRWPRAVMRSLLTLKALTYAPTGGIVAAPTASLPESIGGVRNWDYRYCWVRDATFALYALTLSGYLDEAVAWREWLLRAVAGKPDQMHIMYGLAGERRLPELQLPWLPGYEGSTPVRIGNAAHEQLQLDVYGELLDTMHQCWRAGMAPGATAWRIERAALRVLESCWQEPDEGIWEVRAARQHFTHSKVMAWVAMDRAVQAVEQFGLEGPVDRWKALRQTIHDDVCHKAYNARRGAFVQSYGSDRLDASVLVMPLVGFLPAGDPRMQSTILAIERELKHGPFVSRYIAGPEVDGLPAGEGPFLLCSFWLADNLALLGRYEEAAEIFEGVLGIANDVGLLAEGYDLGRRRLAGNFPQAFSHIGLVNSARNLSRHWRPAEERPSPERAPHEEPR